MADISEDQEVKVAIETAETFVNTYYVTISKPHAIKEIPDFYVKPNPESPLKPDISLNGNLISSPSDLEAVFEKQPPKTHYEVQSFDCHVLNRNYNVGVPDNVLEMNKHGRKMSIMVTVSGSVRYGDGADIQGFMDSLVLVPNWEAYGKPHKGKRRWLVQSQTFRLVL
ncbi:NTF2-like protein [Glarea lozoyensis ATCC 20868]|uniref:NTF2-like protein n=1 Tax=Glarea lozoyensis (strain ATCC 20868 / MF5171) TaxID=1116229 RepID=S3DJV0_GLAL2|nr:NTF2-like protein [Glarea lozoyensis ATCC 20868]EPE32311.1 NTF2-like protein [Glarea lozoyensis ATCC 20868]